MTASCQAPARMAGGVDPLTGRLDAATPVGFPVSVSARLLRVGGAADRLEHPRGHRRAVRAGEREGAVERTLDLRGERLAQAPPGAQVAGLDGRRGDAERFGDILDAH